MAPEEAQANWTLCFTEAEKYCSHGRNCKHGARCTVGRRIEYKHLLTGAVLPFWNQIQSAVGYRDVATAGGGYRQQSNMQVRVRVRGRGRARVRVSPNPNPNPTPNPDPNPTQIVRLRVDKTALQPEQRLVGVLIDDRQLALLQVRLRIRVNVRVRP